MNNPKPQNLEAAIFSIPFAAACSFKYGNVTPIELLEQIYFDIEVQNLMQKVNIIESPELNRFMPAGIGSILTVTTSKNKFIAKVIDPLGSPENPLSEIQLEKIFYSLADSTINNTDSNRLYTLLQELDQNKNIQEILEITKRNRKV